MTRPTLWHIAISHYSEKVRWALDYKRIDHERREPPPGAHIAFVLWKTRGRSFTLPMLELDGRRIADSTAIIATLEDRYPEPSLYPKDRTQRRRALALEEWFDEELGPYIRRLGFHEYLQDRELFARASGEMAPASVAPLGRALVPAARAFSRLRYGAGSQRRADQARIKVVAALDRLGDELGSGEYLVGDRFSVADLTAASLFYGLARPPEGPGGIEEAPEGLRQFRNRPDHRRSLRWVSEMFRRHRHPAAVSSAVGVL